MKVLSTTLLGLCIAVAALAQPEEENSFHTSLFIPAEKTIYYKLGDATIPILIAQYGEEKELVFINVHDNETTSVEAARNLLQLRGGTLIKLVNSKQRVIRFRFHGQLYSFDPNRMFSRVGIEQSLKENGRMNTQAVDEIEKFGQRILEMIPSTTSCIIALHNNTNEAYSVKSYQPGSDREKDAKEVYTASTQDPDDICFTTDSVLYRKMAEQGYNSILQDNEKVKRDGSLSVWAGENGRRYINIETEHGRLEQYIEMLGKLLVVLSN